MNYLLVALAAMAAVAFGGNGADYEKMPAFDMKPGSVLVLESGKRYKGTIVVENIRSDSAPLTITSSGEEPAIIDAAGETAGISILNSSGVVVDNVIIEADGKGGLDPSEDPATAMHMRCGIYIEASVPGDYSGIRISNVTLRKIFFENPGFIRDKADTYTANGRQAYGFGIKVSSKGKDCLIPGLKIENCRISDLSHTGIKLTGSAGSIHDAEISGNSVIHPGGPGIQMSLVKNVHVHHNAVDHSGSRRDTRNWSRGSGYWCWGSQDILLEYNDFRYAHGPHDSAGAHIDYNCSDIVLQYNFSACNEGGFVEILGNNRNCCYRYNISVNDGARVKGVDGAKDVGRTLWFSGYIGNGRVGPFNSYVYNNTVYLSKDIAPSFFFQESMEGAMIANNIFFIEGDCESIFNENKTPEELKVVVDNNLCISTEVFDEKLKAVNTLIGDPGFVEVAGLTPQCYIPSDKSLVNNGIRVKKIPGDKVGLKVGLDVKYDFFGHRIRRPIMGAAVCQ